MNERLFVSCTPGLEAALAEELAELGFRGARTDGGVELDAPPRSFERLNLWSRLASRVLLRVASVRSPDELRRVDLSRFGDAFDVEGPAKWVAAVKGARRGAGLAVQLRLDGNACTVSIDTSGELLYLRGYRQEIGRAPLRETLASGFLRLAKWAPAEPLWDVMCGSGTIVIEAAERARGLAPGRNRRFAFQQFRDHDAARFAALPRQAGAVPSRILGSDLNAGALGTARRNARRAGVLEHLTLERLDATKLPPREGGGLVVANLPYGKRVGERSELAALYRGLGQALRRAARGRRFAFLLEEGAEHLGLPLATRDPVRNGGIACEVVTGVIP